MQLHYNFSFQASVDDYSAAAAAASDDDDDAAAAAASFIAVVAAIAAATAAATATAAAADSDAILGKLCQDKQAEWSVVKPAAAQHARRPNTDLNYLAACLAGQGRGTKFFPDQEISQKNSQSKERARARDGERGRSKRQQMRRKK